MKNIRTLIAVAGLGTLAAFGAGPAQAATGEFPKEAPDISFPFEGPFGMFDRAQLQRGFQVYQEVCSTCHGMDLLHYRNLGDPGGPEFPEAQVKAIAGTVQVEDGPNDEGEMFTRPGDPADPFVSPFPNEEAARVANGGSLPPDLSLITKSREGWTGTFNQLVSGIGGPEYVHAVLTGYEEAPADAEGPPGSFWNPYFTAGPWIKMPPPLTDGAVEYADGTETSADQMSRDVSAFLAWAAEPKMEQRKSMGFQVLIYMAILSVLLYLTKKKIWSRVEH